MELLNLKERSLLDKLFLDKSEFDKVCEIVGDIEIVERRNIEEDKKRVYTCARYALGDKIRGLLRNGFLDNDGSFEEVENPKEGDIVVYTGEYLGYPDGWFHVGIYDGEKVVSKWGYGHVFRHDLNLVPTYYGNKVKFFREKNTKQI